MKYTILPLLLLTLLSCAATQSGSEARSGGFVISGPASANGENMSMRWRYGLALNFGIDIIENIEFSCSPINGTKFSQKSSELKVLQNGVILAEGPVMEVSVQSTPWLYADYSTQTICTANMKFTDGTEATVAAPVNFTSAVKKATLQQLALAHKFNKG